MSAPQYKDNADWQKKLTGHEGYLRDLIGDEEVNSTILGFLPVSESRQAEIIREVKSCPVYSLGTLLRLFPAVTTYVVALARAMANEDGKKFWECVQDGTGKSTDINERESLSHQFQSTCESLGLRTGAIGQKGHIAPFIFQAGIMFYWERGENAYLSNGYRTTIKTTPIPSAEDWERCYSFATELATHCYGSTTLKNILNDDLGALLVQRLVRYYEGDESALPPHLGDAFKKERKEGRKLRLPSPYLSFDRFQNELLLILPEVQSSLADEGTIWEWNGTKYFASHQTSIPLKASNFKEHEITIHNLRRGFRDQTFKVDASLDHRIPFRVFPGVNGRERSSCAGKTSELAAGCYHIIAHSELHAGEDNQLFRDLEHFRVCDLEEDNELRPGDPALNLVMGDKLYHLSCRIEPGFFMSKESSQSLRLTDGLRMHWGASLEFTGYLPIQESDDEEIILEISSPSLPASKVNTLKPVLQGYALQFTEELNESLIQATEKLSPGVHYFEITLSQGANRASRKFFFWKGLKHVNETSGFYCSISPENIDLSESRGLKKEGSNLLFNADQSPRFSIALNDGKTLELKRTGVSVTIIDEDDEEALLPAATKSIVVIKGDRRRLAFRSGGFQSWDVRCGSYTIGKLTPTKTTHIASMSSILSEGGTGPILAYPRNHPDDAPVHLTRLYSPVTCKQPEYFLAAAGGDDSYSFSFATEGLYELGVRIYDISDKPTLSPGPVLLLASRRDDFSPQRLQPAPGISIHANGTRPDTVCGPAIKIASLLDSLLSSSKVTDVNVSLIIDREETSDRFYLIDILHRESSSHEWEFANARERVGNSLLRFPVFGSALPNKDSPWWHFVRHSRQSERNRNLPEEALNSLAQITPVQLDQALKTCQKLLNFHYPKSVWTNPESRHQAKWLENWPHALCDDRLLKTKEHSPIWWSNASSELDEFTRLRNSPVSKSFLFGSSRAALFLPPSHYAIEQAGTVPPSRLIQSLELGGKIAQYGGTLQVAQDLFAKDEGNLCKNAFYAFKNFANVVSGKSSDFGTFNFTSFFNGLSESLEEEEFDDEEFLLSAAHLHECCKATSKRSRLLEQASNEQRTKGLSGLTTQLQAAYSRLSKATPFIARHLRLERDFVTQRSKDSADKEFQKHWTPPGLASPFARRIADLIWCLTATSRLAAHGHISKKVANSILDVFFLEAKQGHQPLRISSLLSFGPELFAYYVALFDFAFSKSTTE